MNLIIDIGNTLTKVATFSGDQLHDAWTGPFDQAPGKIREVMQADNIRAAILSSVLHPQGEVPETLHFMQEAGVRVITARHDMPLPISIFYHSPETLGTDRIAAAAAGHYFSPDEAVLVINAGSCLTTDLVTANGEYLGGTISPGLQMRLRAMHHFTGNLPLIAYEDITKSQDDFTNLQSANTFPLPGRTTRDAMLLGAKAGMAAEIDGLIAQYQREISFFNVILSGGDIKIFDKKLKNRIFAIENIVLHGLNQILNQHA